MAKKKVTIQEIARRCSVSPATVSRVLNRNPYVSVEVRQRVGKVLEELNYHHTEFNTGYVAVIQPPRAGGAGISTDIYSRVLADALAMELYPLHYRVIFLGLCDYPMIRSEQFQGIISLAAPSLLPSVPSDNAIPIIFLNFFPERSEGVFRVGSDEMQGMELALSYLYRHNHRHVGLLGVGNQVTIEQRSQAFLAAAEKLRMTPQIELVAEEHDFYEQLGKLVNTGISALVVPGEEVGLKVSYALQLFQYRIPQDISIISWETPNISEYWHPRMTTVSQDFAGLARATANILTHLQQKQPVAFQTEVPHFLIERNSVAMLPGVFA